MTAPSADYAVWVLNTAVRRLFVWLLLCYLGPMAGWFLIRDYIQLTCYIGPMDLMRYVGLRDIWFRTRACGQFKLVLKVCVQSIFYIGPIAKLFVT